MACIPKVGPVRGSHRYGLVLVAITIPIAYSLAAPTHESWSAALTVVLFGGAIMFSLVVSQAHQLVQIVAAVLLAAVVATAVADLIVGSKLTAGLPRAIVALMIALAPLSMARGVTRHLRAEGQVTLDAVFGAIAIYLMLGAMFASIDAAIGTLGPTPFFKQGGNPAFETYMYFSYITMATVGYGDYTPGPALARAMSILESLTGQLYLVTVVALLVSNIGRTTHGTGHRILTDEDEAPEPPPRRP
jgi:ion channel